MITIAITGSIASGKTTVLGIFKKLGYPTISCDEIYHQLLSCDKILRNKLIKTFGEQILDETGNISTKKLSEIVCQSMKNLYLLEKISHPYILKEVFKQLKKFSSESKLCVVDVPLLFEVKLDKKFDYIITVYCDKKTQMQRLKKRKVNKKLLKLLLRRQMPIKKKIYLSDFVIKNCNISKRELEKKVLQIISQITLDN